MLIEKQNIEEVGTNTMFLVKCFEQFVAIINLTVRDEGEEEIYQ